MIKIYIYMISTSEITFIKLKKNIKMVFHIIYCTDCSPFSNGLRKKAHFTDLIKDLNN